MIHWAHKVTIAMALVRSLLPITQKPQEKVEERDYRYAPAFTVFVRAGLLCPVSRSSSGLGEAGSNGPVRAKEFWNDR